MYMGQTRKPLNARINGHKYAVRLVHVNSAVFKQVRVTNHAVDGRAAKPVFKSNLEYQRFSVGSAL